MRAYLEAVDDAHVEEPGTDHHACLEDGAARVAELRQESLL